MTTTIEHQSHEVSAGGEQRRQLRVLQVILAGAAAIALLALFDAGRPSTAQTALASGSVQLADLPARASAPVGTKYPQTSPSLVGGSGFAADGSDDQAQQQAQQQMQQAEQQAEEQQELANQEAQQAEQQGLQTEQQANLSTP
jgi:hypothetical protein